MLFDKINIIGYILQVVKYIFPRIPIMIAT